MKNSCSFSRVLAAAAVLGTPLLSLAPARCQTPPASPRIIVDLDPAWRFLREDAPGADQPAFDDAAWQTVALPHTWNAADGADGGNNYHRGVGWYRRRLRVDPALSGKSLFLQFDGAATVTDVYVNGKPAGEHRGNFAGFCFDVTSLLKPGQDNVIAVKVNNAQNSGIAPLSGDFTVYGGLYRDVRLLALDPLSITPLDFDGPGVYVKQAHVTDQTADLEITTFLRNSGRAVRAASVRSVIADASGKTIATLQGVQAIPAGGATVQQKVSLPAPHLWDGVNDPYLYHVTTEVYEGKRLADRVVQPLGLRYFRVDPNTGFFLNGKHYDLHGVNRHQDRQDKGWAISPADHMQDYALIREMGSTGIRLSHYQHAQLFYDLCDQGGLVVWAELPLVNGLNRTPEFAENAKQQLTELIKQNYNHPSILFWSLFNELSFPKTATPEDWALLYPLNDLAHRLDPTRLTTAASNNISADHPINLVTDIIAFNRYYGWYGDKPSDWPKQLDALHAKYPNRPIAISEYGGGASVHQHEEYPPKQPLPGARWHPEEWQADLHETTYKALAARPWIWGTFLWCMFDFGSDGRKEGDHLGRNDKGMVTYDRVTKKDAFYWYQANWTAAPFVHINSSRFDPRPAQPSTIKVYSNCETVELTVGGKSLGSRTAPDHVFVWDAVPLQTGANAVVATGTAKDGKTVTDTCTWNGSAPAVAAGP